MKLKLIFPKIRAFFFVFISLLGSIFCSMAQTEKQESSPKQLVDALHSAFGDHHARAVHAKGIILSGTFTPSPVASTISKEIGRASCRERVLMPV